MKFITKYLLLIFCLFGTIYSQNGLAIGGLNGSLESGCEVGFVKPKITIFKTPNGSWPLFQGTYWIDFKVNGNVIVRDYPGDMAPGLLSNNHTLTQGFNFAPDQTYNVEFCVYWNFNGTVESNCKTFTIVSNAPPVAGNIIGPEGFCLDGGNIGAVTLNQVSSFGTVENWYYKNVETGGAYKPANDYDNELSLTGLQSETDVMLVVSNGYCGSDTAYQNLLANVMPTSGVLKENAILCKGLDNSYHLKVEGGSAQKFLWNVAYDGANGSFFLDSITTVSDYFKNNINVSMHVKVLLSNDGCPAIESNVVELKVIDNSTLGDLSVNPEVVCEGDNEILVKTIGAITDAYNWEQSLDGNVWQSYAATSSAFQIMDLTEDVYFRLRVKNDVCPEYISDPLYIQVDQKALAPSLTGGDEFCLGANSGTIAESGSSQGNVLSFEWANDRNGAWTTVAGFNGNHSFTNLTDTTYFRVVYQSGVCPNDTSNLAIVNMNAPTQAGVLNKDSLICTGNNGQLSLENYIGGITQWEYKNINANVWSEINHNSDIYQFANLTDTTQFRVLVKSGVCPEEYSNVITLDYVQGPDAGTISEDGVYCVTNVNHLINVQNYMGSLKGWQESSDGVSFTDINVSTDAYYATGLQETKYYRVVFELNNCPVAYSDTVKVQVDPESVGGVLTQDTAFCFGDANYYAVLNNYTSEVLGYQYSIDDGSNWMNFNNSNSDTLEYEITNTSLFRAVVKSGVCPETFSSDIEVVVHPLPVVEAGSNQTLFQGDEFVLEGHTDELNFVWFPQGDLLDVNELEPMGVAEKNNMYYLSATTDKGCNKVDSVLVTIYPPDPDFDTITNLITVNNDGLNDFWVIKGIERYPNNHVKLFDKFGREVYYQQNYINDFKGEGLPEGNYIYLIYFDDFDRKYKGVLKINKY